MDEFPFQASLTKIPEQETGLHHQVSFALELIQVGEAPRAGFSV